MRTAYCFRLIVCLAVLAGQFAWSAAYAQKLARPDDNRFRRVTLFEGPALPFELEVAADGRVYWIDGGGAIQFLEPGQRQLRTLGTIATHDGSEHGLIGMALDPDFSRTGWLYLQYFKPGKNKVARLSRFTIRGDSLEHASEKVYLEYPYENTCCHTGGSLCFDAQGNLYAATGDNSNAFFTRYALIDDRSGTQYKPHDALRSAGNTNDLRGKILRIHPEPDGSYTIPAGNLFAKDTPGTRPEIYIMGCRNPYRITVDRPTGILYWGEVGPDADRDSTRGPRGYDEFNQARQAGNFGWPLFIGNSQAYTHVDFRNNEQLLGRFDPLRPINFSANNTGLRELPPAQNAFIWYPYDASPDFPAVGVGGRTAISGPVYRYDAASASPIKFPAYFDGCWFIADWMRNWLKVVHVDDEQRFRSLESFLPNEVLHKPIDMAFGPDGALYLLEFGSNWSKNSNARLSRIEYIAGNRPPVAVAKASRYDGRLPLNVVLSAASSVDYDGDSLRYEWRDGRGRVFSQKATSTLTLTQPGRHVVTLTVTDVAGATARHSLELLAGNTRPTIQLKLPNQTFYQPATTYKVEVADVEDGTLGKGIRAGQVQVRASLIPRHQSAGTQLVRGEVLLNESDCKACHQLNAASVGPSFKQIAQRYGADESKVPTLTQKVLKGGGGVWGSTHQMSAHPQISEEQARDMVRYILSLSQPVVPLATGISATIIDRQTVSPEAKGHYLIEARYTDRGGKGVKPLRAESKQVLRSSVVNALEFDQMYDASYKNDVLTGGRHESWAMIRHVDLTGIRQLTLMGAFNGRMEIHLDSPAGPLVGATPMQQRSKELKTHPITLTPTTGFHDVYIRNMCEHDRFSGNVTWRWVSFDGPRAAEVSERKIVEHP